MNKTAMTILCATISMVAFCATPIATQEWVKKYISKLQLQGGSSVGGGVPVSVQTNATTRAISFSSDAEYENIDIGTNEVFLAKGETLSIVAKQATNLVFKVAKSNVDGVTNGLVYRVTDGFLYSRSATIPQIAIRKYVGGSDYPSLERSEPPRNANGMIDITKLKPEAKKATWQLVASNLNSHVEYTSLCDGGYWHMIAKNNPSNRFSLVAINVSDEEARRAYTAAIARSRAREIFESAMRMFIPQAVADSLLGFDFEMEDFVKTVDAFSPLYVDGIEVTKKSSSDNKSSKRKCEMDLERGATGYFTKGGDGEYDYIKLLNGSETLKLEDMLDPNNWDLPIDEDGKIALVDQETGEETHLSANQLKKTKAWQEFIKDAYKAIMAAIEVLQIKHVCEPNPQNDCLCYEFDSIHYPNGRGSGNYEFCYADTASIENFVAAELHVFEKIGRCKVCIYNPAHAEHNSSGTRCGCDCGAITASRDRDDGLHTKKANGCGCECGAMKESEDEGWHKFDDESCKCKCKKIHKFKASACPNVCVCGEVNADGETPTADDHSPRPLSDRHCGCKCGHINIDDPGNDKFHYQMPGTCRCYGDGTGGSRHYHQKSLCPKICALCGLVDHGGLVTTCTEPTDADHESHGGNLCGCKCRMITDRLWHVPTTDHNLCGCQCGNESPKQHHFIEGFCTCRCGDMHQHMPSACPKVCSCCGKVDLGTKQLTPTSILQDDTEENHDPSDKACACACGKYSAGADLASRWHHGKGVEYSCRCLCELTHKGYAQADEDGCAFCDVCNYSKDMKSHRSVSEGHVMADESCDCKCGTWLHGSLQGHQHPPEGSCYCYCGEELKEHQWGDWEKRDRFSFTCDECGMNVFDSNKERYCNRCNEYDFTPFYTWGHDPSCGKKSEEQNWHCPECGCGDIDCLICPREGGNCHNQGGSGGDGEGKITPTNPVEDI